MFLSTVVGSSIAAELYIVVALSTVVLSAEVAVGVGAFDVGGLLPELSTAVQDCIPCPFQELHSEQVQLLEFQGLDTYLPEVSLKMLQLGLKE